MRYITSISISILMSAVAQSAASTDPAQGERAQSTARTTRPDFVQNIDDLTVKNRDFRRELYTGKHLQLVLMSIPPGEHIGEEVHAVDQFFRVEAGSGIVVIDGVRHTFATDFAFIVPAGAKHDVINTGAKPLQLYTIYSPPHHPAGTVHRTRADASREVTGHLPAN
jgi:mannose-6-phosphate isomerase-like protein (cupin superfamily)